MHYGSWRIPLRAGRFQTKWPPWAGHFVWKNLWPMSISHFSCSRTTMLRTTFFVKGTEIASEINEKIASTSSLLNYLACQLSLVLLFIRGEYFMLVTRWKSIFFSYPILYRAIRAKTRPFPVLTRYRTNSKPFGFKTTPDFFGSPIRTANGTRIRPVPWVPCKRKAESYKLVNGSEFIRSRVNVVLLLSRFIC